MSAGITIGASIIPVQHLEPATLALFMDYTSRFEQSVSAPFTASGKLWIDDDHSSKHKDFDAGKPVVEARENADIHNGSIHHYSGSIRVPGGKIDQVRRVMQDYANYPTFFKPDVVRGSGSVQADSTPDDEHFKSRLFLTESTVWLDVAYITLSTTRITGGSTQTDGYRIRPRSVSGNYWMRSSWMAAYFPMATITVFFGVRIITGLHANAMAGSICNSTA